MGSPVPSRGQEVAPGVYRFGSARINWYVMETDTGITVVDTGAPAHREQFDQWLETKERDVTDVEAILLTHAHIDHIGNAERLRTASEAPVYIHEADALRSKRRMCPPVGLVLRAHRPAIRQLLREGIRDGLVSPPPISTVTTCVDRQVLEIPGRPEIYHVPGHTPGNCAFWVPSKGILFGGDTLVTRNLLNGNDCPPRPMPALFSEDYEQSIRSLARIEALEDVTLLPGHGNPWTGNIADCTIFRS